MSKKFIVKKRNGILLKDVGEMTLNELMSQDDVEVVKKGHSIKMKKNLEDQTISVEILRYNNGETISQSKFNKPQRKKDLAQTVKDMYANNMTQEQIAFHLGISQAYVSILLKQ